MKATRKNEYIYNLNVHLFHSNPCNNLACEKLFWAFHLALSFKLKAKLSLKLKAK